MRLGSHRVFYVLLKIDILQLRAFAEGINLPMTNLALWYNPPSCKMGKGLGRDKTGTGVWGRALRKLVE